MMDNLLEVPIQILEHRNLKDEDIIAQILQRNKKILGFSEVEHLFKTLKDQKPQFKVIQYISSEFKPEKVPSFVSRKSALVQDKLLLLYRNKILSGSIISLKVFDEEQQRLKCLKIYFMDHFVYGFFINEINSLYQNSKTLLRTDLILQVHDTYVLSGNEQCKAYYVIEYENYENSLYKLYSHLRPFNFPESLKQIMETALSYCSDRSNIKEIPKTRALMFPVEYLKYFFMVKDQNNECKVKLNVLANDLFQSPMLSDDELIRSTIKSPSSSKKKQEKKKRESQVKELNQKLGRLLLDVQSLNTIKKNDLVQIIQKNFQQLLESHDREIFEIIAQHPKYNEFELEEYGSDFFILGTTINGHFFNLKCEKFNSLREVEDQIKLYEQYYSIDEHMLVPVTSFDPIILEDGFYVLIEEQVMPNSNKFKKNKQPANLNSTYISIQQMCQKKDAISRVEKLRVLQVVVQLFKFAQHLHSNNFYHGDIEWTNTLVNYPNAYSAQLPTLYFSNPLFLRTKASKKKQRESNGDYDQLDDMTFMLLIQDQNDILDRLARNKLIEMQEKYFEDLKFGRIIKNQMKNAMQNEETDIDFYIRKLNHTFALFEGLYKNNMPDKYIQINKNWQTTLRKHKEAQQNFQYHHHDEDSDIYDDSDDFFDDSDDDGDDGDGGYWELMDSDDIDSDLVDLNQGIRFLDQCTMPQMFELQIDKIVYNFRYRIDYTVIEILKSIAKNNNLVSINFKCFSSSPLRTHKNQKDHSIDYLNNIIKNCKNLQTIKVEIIQEDFKMLDVKLIQQLSDLKNIKLSTVNQYNLDEFKSESQFLGAMSYYQDLLELFQFNKHFRKINIFPYNSFISGFHFSNLEWYVSSMLKTYEQIKENISKMESNNNNKKKKQQKQVQSYSQLTNLDLATVSDKIQSKLNERNSNIENKLDSFFKGLKIRKSRLRKEAQHILQSQINQILGKNLFLTASLQISEENNRHIYLEFENVLDQEMGKYKAKLEYRDQIGFVITNSECKNLQRYKCYQFLSFVGFDNQFNHRMVDKWLISDYETKVKNHIFGDQYVSVCKHCDSLQIQKLIYSGQRHLEKLSLYVEFCEGVNNILNTNKDFFGLSTISSKHLYEIKLAIRYFDIRNRKIYFKNLRHQLENAQHVSKITLTVDASFFDASIKRQLMKIKRLVAIQIKSQL